MNLKRLPIGIDDFSKIRERNYYYVDKTGMIKELLNNCGEVNLFTRPRRFGKTLNMSMLKNFFEIGTDKSIFEGLSILEEEELCEEYMGQFPVISLTLKQVKGSNYEDAKKQLGIAIYFESRRFFSLLESDMLSEDNKNILRQLQSGKGELESSLLQLSEILYLHYRKKVIILIDEYDVPLQKANENGYYKEMAGLISQLFGYGLKSNSYMEFSVVTGCLRVSKESIFTGFNNPKMHTIVDTRYDEWFGFTEEEVKDMLRYYQKEDYYDITKEWYDGYLFGNVNVYNPWDVINWCDVLNSKKRIISPELYWVNSSENEIIRHLADMADDKTRSDMEKLLQGETIKKKINLQLTYNEIYSNIDNVWNVLFMTGYLTFKGQDEDGYYELVIPNKEVQQIMQEQIRKWFFESVVSSNYHRIEIFFNAFLNGDVSIIQKYLNVYLKKSISIRDSQAESGKKENFYHGLLLGMLNIKNRDWEIESNVESGDGYSDIRVSNLMEGQAFLIEVKYADSEKHLNKSAQEAVEQIETRRYERYFIDRGYTEIKSYGIAFYKKECVVLLKS